MFKDLATSRRFAPLFWCQLCSALNDNFLKNALVMLILYGLGSAGSSVGTHGPTLVTLAGIVFALLLIYVVNRAFFGWTIAVHWPFGLLAWQNALVLLAAALASFYPAWVASSTPTTELRREDL